MIIVYYDADHNKDVKILTNQQLTQINPNLCIHCLRFSFQEKKISGLEWDRTHTLTYPV